MTDLEAFIELYSRFGISCIVNQCPDTGNLFINLAPYSVSEKQSPTESEKFEGHYGYYSRIDFDKEGKFIKQGFWE